MFDTRGGLDRSQAEGDATAASPRTAEVDVTDGFTLRSRSPPIARTRATTPIDFDALPAVDVDVPAIYKNNQFSQESSWRSTRGPLTGLVGAYYLDANANNDLRRPAVHEHRCCPASPPSTDGDVDTKTWADLRRLHLRHHRPVQRLGRRPLHQRQAPCDVVPPEPILAAAGSPAFGGVRHPVPGAPDLGLRRQAQRHGVHAARLGQLQAERRSQYLRRAIRRASRAAASIRAA